MNRPVTLVEPGTVRLERLLPGPVERGRFLARELSPGALRGAGGPVLPLAA